MTALYAALAVAVPVLAFVALLAYQGRRIDRRDLTPYAPLGELLMPQHDMTRPVLGGGMGPSQPKPPAPPPPPKPGAHQ